VHGEVKLHDLTKVAQILEQYVMSGEDSVAAVYHAAKPKVPQKAPQGGKTGNIEGNFIEEAIKGMEAENDDLPF
jgi:hypothetical protein